MKMKTILKKLAAVLLAVALAVTAAPVMAADATAPYEVQMTQAAKGNQAVVTISATGNLRAFDIGVLYEGAIITADNIEWAPEFTNGYMLQGGTAVCNVTEKGADYAVVVGAMMNCTYEGPICTMTFTITDEQAQFQVMRETASVPDVLEATPVTKWQIFEGVELSPNAHKVEFCVEGKVVSVQFVEDGQAAVAPKNPSKVSDEEYFYTFKGWDQSFDQVKGAMVINALFEANKKSAELPYEVEVTPVIKDNQVTLNIAARGDVSTFDIGVLYEGATITSKNIAWDMDFALAYIFQGGTCVMNVTSKNGAYALVTGAKSGATYDGTLCTMTFTVDDPNARYKVVSKTADFDDINEMPAITGWQDFLVPSKVEFCVDGKVVDTQWVKYGEAAVAPLDPMKEEDERNIYIFKGWDQSFEEVKGAMVINAVFDVIPKFMVEFRVDDVVVDTQWVKQGEAAKAPADPVKEETEYYKYAFAGWDVAFDRVTEDLVINATFEVTRKFELGKVNDDAVINAQDALLVLKDAANLTELTEAQIMAGDINQDGRINAADALLILQKAAGIIEEFPDPVK